MATPADTVDVLVVGAGPSGLMAALCLLRLGVSVALVDGKAGPTRESRALAHQARTMELYDQLGIVDAVLAEAERAPAIVPGHRTRTFSPVSFGEFGRTLTPYPGVYVLEQSRTERILGDAFARAGGRIRWQHPLEALELDPAATHPVTARIGSPDGPVTLRSRWCVAADGASSAVRRMLNVAFEGTTVPFTFYVLDALDATGLVEGCVNLRASRDDILLAFPMGGEGHHRLLGVVEEQTDEQAIESAVRARLASEFGVAYTRRSWLAHYRVHHRLAEHFRRGPVFLVGDAAHVHSPVGAQGMNTGLQDAHNLACKLAEVAHGRADDAWLDRYEAERRPVARRLVSLTDAAFLRITSRSRLARFARDRVVPAVGPWAVRVVPRLVGTERIFGYLAQLRIHYWMSDAERRRRRGRRDRIVGRRLSWSGENFEVLREFTWQVHGYGADASAVAETAASLGLTGHAFAPDRFGRLRADRLYLVRPDGFVVAAAAPATAVVDLAPRLPTSTRPSAIADTTAHTPSSSRKPH